MKINELFYLPTSEWSELRDYEIQEIIRMVRNRLLQESDWTQLPDSPLTDAKRAEWSIYRQALRDITKTYPENLLDTEFPNTPEL
jgi:hypothetical protein